MEVDFLKKSIGEIDRQSRLQKEDEDEKLAIKRQCELLEVCRSSFYYVPRQEGSDNQELMKRIDKQYMETLFYGVLQMTEYLKVHKFFQSFMYL